MSSPSFKVEADKVLLISCAGDDGTGGGLCAFDGEELYIIDRVSTAGLTFFNGHLARLLRTPITTSGGEILVYDDRGISHYLRVDKLSDAHYMVWNGQHLIVASTGNNSLLWVGLSGSVVREWRATGEDDSWHLNDVCIVEGRLYACAFGQYKRYRDYKDYLSSGDGFVFDVETGKVVVAGLYAPHNPRHFDGAWTVCDSLRNSIVQFEADTGRRRRQATLRSFTRGLAITSDYVIVGESATRETGTGATGSVAFLRRSDFGFVARVDLPFLEVSDIVVVPRAAMNGVRSGFRTNPLRVGETDQLQLFRDVGIEPKRLWAVSERLAANQYKVRIHAQIAPRFIPGKLRLVECTVENLSDAFLCSELPHAVNLSYKWRSVSGSSDRREGVRTKLPRMLPPSSSIACRMEILAPNEEGEFDLIVTLVQEGVAWFDDIDAANACAARVRVIREESHDADHRDFHIQGVPSQPPSMN